MILLENVIVDCELSILIEVPKNSIIETLIVESQEARLECKLLVGEYQEEFELYGNDSWPLIMDENVILKIKAKHPAKIIKLVATTIPKPKKGIKKDINIIHHPCQGVIIAFDFKKAMDNILEEGWEPQPEIQIREPDSKIITVKESSLFAWKEELLHCKLTVGERWMRFRCNLLQPWSDWWSFTCMSAKKYRRKKR